MLKVSVNVLRRKNATDKQNTSEMKNIDYTNNQGGGRGGGGTLYIVEMYVIILCRTLSSSASVLPTTTTGLMCYSEECYHKVTATVRSRIQGRDCSVRLYNNAIVACRLSIIPRIQNRDQCMTVSFIKIRHFITLCTTPSCYSGGHNYTDETRYGSICQ